MRIQKYFWITLFREILVSKSISPILNEVLKSIVKCISGIKAKCEYHLNEFREDKRADHKRLLFHTEAS